MYVYRYHTSIYKCSIHSTCVDNKQSGPDRLEASRLAGSRTPSPLIRMKTIHNSEEETEARRGGRVLLVPDRTKESPSPGLPSSTVPSQAGTMKDPEVLIQIVKPRYIVHCTIAYFTEN